jgi:uncharacterized coiled-coil protein SlyX
MNESLEARVETLETILTHLQKAYDELNLVVYNQQREIDAIKQAMGKLTVSYQSLVEAERSPRTLADDRPPHY